MRSHVFSFSSKMRTAISEWPAVNGIAGILLTGGDGSWSWGVNMYRYHVEWCTSFDCKRTCMCTSILYLCWKYSTQVYWIWRRTIPKWHRRHGSTAIVWFHSLRVQHYEEPWSSWLMNYHSSLMVAQHDHLVAVSLLTNAAEIYPIID